ncbi:hypothetical protein [Amycolatopsis sp. NPDC059657]|uniref:hypothetical protein n=1 Tax=Amycolatopsis sp. NPDC059657 TaxID=3346899 RepID=UPI00366E91FE
MTGDRHDLLDLERGGRRVVRGEDPRLLGARGDRRQVPAERAFDVVREPAALAVDGERDQFGA